MENTEDQKPKNPQAFPATKDMEMKYQGMTLRDYFAAKAMQALLSNRDNIGFLPGPGGERNRVISGLCQDSFDVADAMLKAREI